MIHISGYIIVFFFHLFVLPIFYQIYTDIFYSLLWSFTHFLTPSIKSIVCIPMHHPAKHITTIRKNKQYICAIWHDFGAI